MARRDASARMSDERLLGGLSDGRFQQGRANALAESHEVAALPEIRHEVVPDGGKIAGFDQLLFQGVQSGEVHCRYSWREGRLEPLFSSTAIGGKLPASPISQIPYSA